MISGRFANGLVGDSQTKGTPQSGKGSSGPTAGGEQGSLFLSRGPSVFDISPLGYHFFHNQVAGKTGSMSSS